MLSNRSPGLPGPALAFLYTLTVALPVALAWAEAERPAGFPAEAAAAAGLVGLAMLLLQFVTSGRFESLAGRIGIDHTMAFHKWAARVLLVAVLLHPLLFAIPSTPDRLDVFATRLVTMLTSPRYLAGTVALVLVVLVTILAIFRDRLPVPYEVWRASHGLAALAAGWLAVLHAIDIGTYSQRGPLAILWPALAAAGSALFLGVHAVKSYRMVRRGWRVASNRRVADGLWELVLAPEPGTTISYRAGQFVWLAFAPRRLLLLDHPFSIASSPASGRLTFLIKEAGDFTGRIGTIAPGTPAGVDGPHGSFTLDGLDCEAILLVAGGAGIAPLLGILRDLAARRDPRPVRLVYAGRTATELIEAETIAEAAAGLDFSAMLVLEQPPPAWPGRTGRVDDGVLDLSLRHLPEARTAAFICGPGAMVAAAADGLERLGVPRRLIRYERFDYGAGPQAAKDRRVTAAFQAMTIAVLVAGAAFALR